MSYKEEKSKKKRKTNERIDENQSATRFVP